MTAEHLPDGRIPVLLSAHAADLIGQDAAAILAHLDRHPTAEVTGVAATLLATRRLRRHRAVIRCADRAELADGLRALVDDREHPLVTRSSGNPPQHAESAPRIAFVFPGQGSQWPSMGVEAYELPDYRAEVEKCAAQFDAAGVASPLDYLLADGHTTNDFSQVQIQGAQFVHGIALARVWRSAGVLPDITVGHSLGEIGAAYVAGSIGLADAVAVVIARATVLDRLTGPYRVAVLGITPEQAAAVVAETPGWLELSVVNSQSSVAVSGETEAVAAAVRTVVGRGGFAKEIEMWFPAHTSALDPVRPELEALLPAAQFTESPVQFIGSATADVVAAGTGFADYWYTNLRSTVRFDRAVGAAVDRGARIFVELSAHPALLFAMAERLEEAPDLAGHPAVLVGSGRRDEPLTDRLSANITAVALADPGYRWSDLPGAQAHALRDFPFAPMRAEHHWARPEPLPPVAGLTIAVEHWEELAAAESIVPRRIAVLDPVTDSCIAARLRAAIDRNDALTAVGPEAADLLLVVAPTGGRSDAVGAAEELGHRIGTGLLGYLDAITAGTRDVWLVTVGGEQVSAEAPGPLPGPAALAAVHRSIGFEYPDQNFGHIDLPSAEPGDIVAAAALTAMLGDAEDIAVRDNGSGPVRYRLSSRDEPAPAPPWPAQSGILDEVVITGGTGAVGLHYARYLAEHGARRIVLLSRGGADPAQLAGLIGSHDVEILAPRCDITDAAQVSATAVEYAGAGASLVIHAAAAAVMAPGRELGSAAAETFAAKVSGLDHLTASWPLRADARILLCSSVSGLWGGYGHGAYAAANRLLDVMAGQLRAEGRQCTAVRWGLWQGVGIIDADEIARVERSGLRAMVPELAVAASLRDFGSDPMVFSADAERLQTFLGSAPRTVAHPAVEPDMTDLDPTGAVHIALGSVLKMSDTTGLDPDASLLDLGVDSLLALDLRKKLKKATGQSVPLATILGGVTVTELVEHLERT